MRGKVEFLRGKETFWGRTHQSGGRGGRESHSREHTPLAVQKGNPEEKKVVLGEKQAL